MGEVGLAAAEAATPPLPPRMLTSILTAVGDELTSEAAPTLGAVPAALAVEAAPPHARAAQPKLLVVYAGTVREGDLPSVAAQRFNALVRSIDTRRHGAKDDMSVASNVAQLRAEIIRGDFHVAWLAPPCGSYSVVRSAEGSTRRLRGRVPGEVSGLPDLTEAERAYLGLHDALTSAATDLAAAVVASGGTAFIENPADTACRQSPHFVWKWRHHASIWITHAVRALITWAKARGVHVAWATFPMCALGSEYKKLTTVLAIGPRAPAIRSLNRLACTHAMHAKRARGVDGDGNSHAAAAGQYPAMAAACFAETMLAHDPMPAAQWAAEHGHEYPKPRHDVPAAATSAEAASAAAPALACDAQRVPAAWPEAAHMTGEAAETERTRALRHVSRRRAEAESGHVLAGARMPAGHPHPYTVAPPATASGGSAGSWPADAPPRPVFIEQLYLDGVYDTKIRPWIAQACKDCTARLEEVTIGPEEQPAWAARYVWDTRDPRDCVPLLPFSEADPPTQGANAAFFKRWRKVMPGLDADMHHQVQVRGVDSGAQCSRITVLVGHHGGARAHYDVLREGVEADTGKGWVTTGVMHLQTVPARLSPKNVAVQTKWKLSGDELTRVVKHRITTNDSYVADDGASRNGSLPREEWPECQLPTFRDLGRAVAILRSAPPHLAHTQSGLLRIALWAMDLSNAFRELAVARTQWWLQQFIWSDGIRLDMRCLFGTANLVGLFERVSTAVMAVAVHKVRTYDAQHPHGPDRLAWRAWREAEGLEADARWSDIYLDDGFGATPLEPNEQLEGGEADTPIHTCITAAPDGTVALDILVCASRPQAHLQLTSSTFGEAGWGTAAAKKQMGFDIDLLGMGVSAHGDGAFYVPPPKALGLRRDIQELVGCMGSGRAAHRSSVEELVGRFGHVAQVVCEGNAYLAPLYRVKAARVKARTPSGEARAYLPSKLQLAADTPLLREFRSCLEWWDLTLQQGPTAPLAPKLLFPGLDAEGAGFFFTDAAREAGTGFGGWTLVRRAGSAQPALVYAEQRWDTETLAMLQADTFSMPAGECYGAVYFAEALLAAVSGITHLWCFTDSDATAKAFTAVSSGAPQLNTMMQWLAVRRPAVQFVGVHVAGAHNVLADSLSRHGGGMALREAAAHGFEACRVAAPQGAAHLLTAAQRMPLRHHNVLRSQAGLNGRASKRRYGDSK